MDIGMIVASLTLVAQTTPDRVSTRWYPALPHENVESFRCRYGEIVSVTFRYTITAGPVTPSPLIVRRSVLAITANGNVVGRTSIDALNSAMQEFDTEPKFSPQCAGNNYRVNLYADQNGVTVGSRYVSLNTP